MSEAFNPCQSCGACCAAFRVSFYWAEAEARGIAPQWVEQVNERFSCMAGTNRAAPHCIALGGKVGQAVSCAIYLQRPEPCREVQSGDSQCAKARQRHALPPLASDPLA